MSDQQQQQEQEQPEQLNLVVASITDPEDVIFFRIKRTTPLGRLMDAYRKKVNRDNVEFFFNNQPLVDGNTTAQDLGMKDGDMIFSKNNNNTAGTTTTTTTTTTSAAASSSNAQSDTTERVNLSVVNATTNTSNQQVFFRINIDTPLQKLMDSYCQKMEVQDKNKIWFKFGGIVIQPEKCARDYGMKDEDVITLVEEKNGHAADDEKVSKNQGENVEEDRPADVDE